jgi:hypothetical protein
MDDIDLDHRGRIRLPPSLYRLGDEGPAANTIAGFGELK